MSFLNSVVNADGQISDLATASRALQRALSPSSQTIIKYAKAYKKSRQENRNIKHGAAHYEVCAEDGRGAAEPASELAGQGRELHPYSLLPLSKQRGVTEWDALGLEPMAEVSDRDLGSEVDSGRTSSGSSIASSASDDEDVFLSSSEDMSFSTDVSDTRLRKTWDGDSDGFSTDVSESRKRRRGGIES